MLKLKAMRVFVRETWLRLRKRNFRYLHFYLHYKKIPMPILNILIVYIDWRIKITKFTREQTEHSQQPILFQQHWSRRQISVIRGWLTTSSSPSAIAAPCSGWWGRVTSDRRFEVWRRYRREEEADMWGLWEDTAARISFHCQELLKDAAKPNLAAVNIDQLPELIDV